MRCGSGLEVELREIQVVNVWEPHRPNDCRLEVAIDSAAPAEQTGSGPSWSVMEKLCLHELHS